MSDILKAPVPFRLRAMRLSDIEPVMAIESAAFPTPWRASAYQYEIAENRLANYQVLTIRQGDRPERVIGYAGYWLLADEIHISTIAISTDWRQRGLGELLLLNLLMMATNEPAHLVTLEVRKGNFIAQQLYKKFRFEIVGERKRYYQGKEDALLMTVTPLDQAYRRFLKQMRGDLFERLEKIKTLVS